MVGQVVFHSPFGMICMGMGDYRFSNGSPRINEEISLRTVKTFFGKFDEMHKWITGQRSFGWFIFRPLRRFEKKKLMNEKHNSEKAPEPVGLYPHARNVGNLLFLSGVGPRERGTKKIPGVELNEDGTIRSYDIEAQCHSAFKNVRLILEASGSSWANLVDVTVFLTNMKDDFKTYNRIYAEYFKDNQPCRTTVEINCLPTPIGIELKCIATLSDK